jgi:hypothetical protein
MEMIWYDYDSIFITHIGLFLSIHQVIHILNLEYKDSFDSEPIDRNFRALKC